MPELDPKKLRFVDDEEATPLDESKLRIVQANPRTSGVGAMAGGLGAAMVEVMSPMKKAKAAKIAASGGKIEKLKEAVLGESAIAAGTAAGDLAETGVLSAMEGNMPVAKQAFESAGEQAKLSLGFGLPMRGATGVFNKLTFRPTAVRSPEAELAYDTFEPVMKAKGYPPMALDVATDSQVLDILGNVARYGVGGIGKMAKGDEAARQATEAVWEGMASQFGPREEVPTLTKHLHDVIMHAEEVKKAPLKVMRNTAVKEADDLGVALDPTAVKQLIQKNIDQIDELGGFGESISGVTTSKALLNLTDHPTVANLVHLRSIAKSMSRSASADPALAKTPQVGLYDKIAEAADKEIKRGLQEFEKVTGFKLLDKLDLSDKGFAKYYDQFYNDIVTKIKKGINAKGGGSFSEVAEFLTKPERRNSLEFARAAKEAWPAEQWPKIQRSVLNRIREKAFNKTGDVIDGNKLRQLLSGAEDGFDNRIGTETLTTIFGPERVKELRDFASALEFAQRKSPSGLGRVATQLTQGGALIGGAAQSVSSGKILAPLKVLGLVTGTPYLFARLMQSRIAVKAMTKGLRMAPTNPAWPALYSRILGQIDAANLAERLENPAPPRVRQEREGLSRRLMDGVALTQ